TVLCLGPRDASKELRKALAMGADEAVHLIEDKDFRDPASTAEALANARNDLGADLVLCGWKAIDDDSSAVGGMLAERLRARSPAVRGGGRPGAGGRARPR